MTGNVFALFESRFPKNNEKTFIESPNRGVYTYGALEAWVDRFAGYLKSAGAEPGDRIAVQVDKSPESIFLYLACIKAGFVFLPLNTGYALEEIRYFAEDSDPAVFVTTDQVRAGVASVIGKREIATLNADGTGSIIEASAAYLGEKTATVAADADSVASVIYTSGTTGKPKGAMLTHSNLAANGSALHARWGFNPNDVLLHVLPTYHVHGLYVAISCVLLNGTGMIFLDSFDAEAVVDLLPRATVMMGVPTHYTRLLKEPRFDKEACRNMRLFVSGSAPLLPETFEAFRERSGHTILERYGMSEAGIITSNPLDGERIAGTVGYPLPGVEVRIAGEDGNPVATGDVGELEVKGHSLFKGYWGNPEKTAEGTAADGFFKSGDLATMAEDGRVTIVGRAKDLIISGGLNVYPKEIESEIDAIPGVGESAVIGVPHPDFGEGVVAVVTAGRQGLTEDEVLQTLNGRLARFKQPKRVFFIDALPRNPMGKVQKKELRKRFATTFASADEP